MSAINPSAVRILGCAACLVIGGCSEPDDAGPNEWPEGNLPVLSKHTCIESLRAEIVRSAIQDPNVKEPTKEAVDSSLTAQGGKPVLVVHMRLSLDELSRAMREQNGGHGGIRAGDIYAMSGSLMLKPVLPRGGMIEVHSGLMFLRQDFIYRLPESATSLELGVSGIVLAEFQAGPETQTAQTERGGFFQAVAQMPAPVLGAVGIIAVGVIFVFVKMFSS